MHRWRASTGQYHSEPFQFCPLEKNKFRVVSMFIVICALHGMAAWHVACGALPNRPSGHHFRVVSRALGRRALLRHKAVDGMTSFSVCAVLMLGTRCECAQLRIARWW
jgi:hypothetical protein